MKRAFFQAITAVTMLCVGCGMESPDDQGELSSAVDSATITFGANFSQRVSGTLTAGTTVRIAYDPARLPQCRGETNNRPAWGISGFYRVNGGSAQAFSAGPASAQAPSPAVITLPNTAGNLELWFQVSNRWGCNAYDSNYGNNYRFAVAPDPRAPGWVGDGASVISRSTCSGGMSCEVDRRPITSRWTYETWARQRAAIRVLTFDVWKRGVTDLNNHNLWRQLDVKMFYRFGTVGVFRERYVSFERRVGNNARYAVDLRAVDPLPDFPALTACPSVPLTASPDGALVSTTFEYYFVVNGVEYRPAPGQAFQGVFSNYKTPLLSTCIAR